MVFDQAFQNDQILIQPKSPNPELQGYYLTLLLESAHGYRLNTFRIEG
jgi:hypothetical protein